MRIVKEEALLLLVDIQEKLFPHIHNKESLVQKAITLLEGLKILEVPVMAARQYPQGLGDVIPELRPYFLGCWDKTTFSCCDDKDLLLQLEEIGKKKIIIAGVEAHICVLQTVIDLKQLGFLPIIVTDAIGSRKPKDYEIALKRMEYEGAILTTVESLLFELCRQAGTATFKTISQLVK